MLIDEKEHNNITIVDNDGNVFAVISDDSVIERNGFRVLFDVGAEPKE